MQISHHNTDGNFTSMFEQSYARLCAIILSVGLSPYAVADVWYVIVI